MDPTANLKEQLGLSRRITTCADDGHGEADAALGGGCMRCQPDAERLAELVLALNEWITKGGFLPEQWRRDK